MSYNSGWDIWTADEGMLYLEFAEFHVPGQPWPTEQMNLAAITRNLNCRPFTQKFLEHKFREQKKDEAEKQKNAVKERAFSEWEKEQAEMEKQKEKEKRYMEWKAENAEKAKKQREEVVWKPERLEKQKHKKKGTGSVELMEPRAEKDDENIRVEAVLNSTEFISRSTAQINSVSHSKPHNGGWTPIERDLYLELAKKHVAGTPWPITEMNKAVEARGLECRPFTQPLLNREAKRQHIQRKQELENEQAKKKAARAEVKGTELPATVRNAAISEKAGFRATSTSQRDSVSHLDNFSPHETALYREFAKSHVVGTPWPLDKMNEATLARGLNCRPWTQSLIRKAGKNQRMQEENEKGQLVMERTEKGQPVENIAEEKRKGKGLELDVSQAYTSKESRVGYSQASKQQNTSETCVTERDNEQSDGGREIEEEVDSDVEVGSGGSERSWRGGKGKLGTKRTKSF